MVSNKFEPEVNGMKVEKRSIEYIPENERHGKARGLFPIWFGAQMHITTLATGALCVGFGLNLFWGFAAVIIGNLIGATFMALHSAQGPKLGVPQMIQSRAQFGVVGAVIPLCLVVFMYIGFFASSGLLGAQVLSSSLSIDLTWSIVILNIVTVIVTVVGHGLIGRMQKYLSWLFLGVFLVASIIAFSLPVPVGSWSPGNFDPALFMLCVSLVATWQLSFAPYAADYSRYLPSKIPAYKTFLATYTGSVIGSSWMMLLGVLLSVAIPNYIDHSGDYLAKLFGGFAFLMYLAVILGQLSINVFNLYGSFMSTISTVDPFVKLQVTQKTRFFFILGIATVGTALSMWGKGNFLLYFSSFITLIGYFLIPWIAINLTDYYVLRKGKYNMLDIFDINGQYGKVNWITIGTFLVAILIEIPFINTSFYQGGISKALGGADIAWIVGLVIPTIVYYILMKRKLSTTEESFVGKNPTVEIEIGDIES